MEMFLRSKTVRRYHIILIFAISLSFMHLMGNPALAQRVIYVDDNAPSEGDGKSWDTAFQFLQDALLYSRSGDEIRVAQGIYKPDQGEYVIAGDRGPHFSFSQASLSRGDMQVLAHLIRTSGIVPSFRRFFQGICLGMM